MKISATFFVSKNVELKLSAVQFRVLSRRLRATLPEGESFSSLGACATLPEGESFSAERGHFCHYLLNLPLYIFFTIVLPILAC